MIILMLGLLVFIGIHLVPSFPALRLRLIDQFGPTGYKGGFAAISFVGLALLIIGKAYAEFIPVWTPAPWGRHLAMGLMPFAFILLVAAYMPSNVKRLTAHPMLLGITVWAAAHLAANGDLAGIVLFGGLGVFSLFDMWSANKRGAAPGTTHYPLVKDLTVVVIGLAAYGAVLFLHPYLFGVRVLH